MVWFEFLRLTLGIACGLSLLPFLLCQTDGWRDALYNFPENWRGTGRWKVSSKIQQLLNTLKRPKRRPLPEFYLDDEEDLEIAANPKDPNAPKPEGMVMTPARGEQLVVSQSIKNLFAYENSRWFRSRTKMYCSRTKIIVFI